jgi:hypothetical protein
MKGQTLALAFSLAMLTPNSPLHAAKATATCKVNSVDFSASTISVDNACGVGVVTFDNKTKFEFGDENPVDSSKLVVAKTIEPELPSADSPASKITIRDTCDGNPPSLTQNLGKFPLDQIISSVISNTGPDRFSAVEDDADTRDGVLARRMGASFTFSTGYCRVIPDPTHVQCDYAYSNTLANILVDLVKKSVASSVLPKGAALTLDQERSDGSTQTYIDRDKKVLVRFSNSPPTSKITVEVY